MAIDRTGLILTDDDGSGTTGDVLDNAYFQASLDAIDDEINTVRGVVQTTALTGNQDNFSLDTGCGLLRCNNATLLTLRGLAAGVAGQRLTIVSVGAGQVNLANQDANSTAANRIINGVTGTISLAAGVGRVTLQYDDTTDRWRVIRHEQGAFITPTFSAGDFTQTGGTSWGVDAGDATTYAYLLSGRMLTVLLSIQTTDVAGTPSSLNVAVPGGFTSAKQAISFADIIDAGTRQYGLLLVAAAGTVIQAIQGDAGNFTATSSDNTYVRGQISFEVQ